MSDTHHVPSSSPVPAATDPSIQQQQYQHPEHPEHPEYPEHLAHPEHRLPPTDSPAPNYFLLLTFLIGLIAWVTSLASQAIIAATTHNSSTIVGVLWPAFVLQTIIILELLITLPSHRTQVYALQISILAAMSTVLACIGVNTNLFTPPTHTPTHQALVAGWLITAIINIAWILYFTAPSSSPFPTPPDTPKPLPYRTISNPVPINKEPSFTGFGRTANGLEPQEGEDIELGQNRSRVDGEEKRRSDGVWSTYTPGGRGSKAGTRERGSKALTGLGGRSAVGSDGAGNASRRQSAKVEKEKDSGPVQGAQGHEELPPHVYRAEALFPYAANPRDPNELSFRKGEMFNITDKSGKWWEATTADGRTGIVPSNYLRLL